MAKLNDVFAALDAAAPKALSDEYCQRFGAYDNSGVLLSPAGEVTGAVFALDLTDMAIDLAQRLSYNLIVTHHPAIYQKLGCLCEDDALSKKVLRCARLGIGVVSLHLNLDCANGGVDESLAFAVCKVTGKNQLDATLMDRVGGTEGYGRAYDVNETDAKTLFEGLKKELGAHNAYFFDAGKKIRRVASFCGAGADESSVKFALSQGADAVVSSDFKHHILLALVEAGISVIAPTHHATEEYGFRKFYEKISQSLGVCCAFCADERLL